ncbi:MAG: hypothetical protein JJU02_07825 [Cryomorphaceae bacterium]|nr:hypothetical protein [Cryomorphaceae bacterium]
MKYLNTITAVAFIFTISVFLSSCGNDDESNGKNGNGNGKVEKMAVAFDFAFRWGNELVINDEQEKTFHTSEGRPFIFEFPQVYLSEFALVDTDGDTTLLKDVVLMREGSHRISMGEVPAKKEYETLVLAFGLRHAINKGMQPVDFSLEHPLGPKVPSMWWNWDDGYILGRIEGPTNHDHPPSTAMDMNFSWHIGYTENRRGPLTYDITGLDLSKIEIAFNLEHLMESIQVPQEVYSTNMRRADLDRKIADLMSESIEVRVKE